MRYRHACKKLVILRALTVMPERIHYDTDAINRNNEDVEEAGETKVVHQNRSNSFNTLLL